MSARGAPVEVHAHGSGSHRERFVEELADGHVGAGFGHAVAQFGRLAVALAVQVVQVERVVIGLGIEGDDVQVGALSRFEGDRVDGARRAVVLADDDVIVVTQRLVVDDGGVGWARPTRQDPAAAAPFSLLALLCRSAMLHPQQHPIWATSGAATPPPRRPRRAPERTATLDTARRVGIHGKAGNTDSSVRRRVALRSGVPTMGGRMAVSDRIWHETRT